MKRPCPVCQSGASEELLKLHFPLPDDFILSSNQLIQSCQNCGMVFTDSGNTQADYNQFYKSSKKYVSASEVSLFETKRFQQTADCLRPILNLNQHICDLGCGGGGLLRVFHEKGAKHLTGVDAGDLSSQNEFTFLRSDLFDFPKLVQKPFDLITCIGVFEHVSDLHRLIQGITSALVPNGHLYIEVPDAAQYDKNVISPFQDFNLEHINHFSAQALTSLLNQNGFEIVAVKHILQPESERYKMPVVSLLAKNTQGPSGEMQKDETLKKRILSYIDESQKLLNEFDRFLEKSLVGQNEIYIWGVGQLTLKLLELPSLKKKSIRGLVDRSPMFRKLKSIPVVSADGVDPKFPIVIGSVLHASSIAQDIRKKFSEANIVELPVAKPPPRQ
ncbi:MAG: class I SAM-dependent methyltransferase [Bacteriovoracaceae bacterium]